MFRSPVRSTPATDPRGFVIGMWFFYEALDEDQLSVIFETIPKVAIFFRGDLVQVLVPNA
ncbi:hypothetical protein [Rhizobium sp. SSA_523]|uniref:hypothetical protein n=1 Tax=Rhizobium sp. SSA_523 TaxID=2952477 RepID=UPI00209002FE|nr:hypothetical protein [Rhizobium sp. SSA_523]MCO5730094.1 hypothetical protein [Rhizobium sp. SSA_523]WKC25159.1 hypothetical protein QTJ18_14320 [Rhizobium sp. SSA_523]